MQNSFNLKTAPSWQLWAALKQEFLWPEGKTLTSACSNAGTSVPPCHQDALQRLPENIVGKHKISVVLFSISLRKVARVLSLGGFYFKMCLRGIEGEGDSSRETGREERDSVC